MKPSMRHSALVAALLVATLSALIPAHAQDPVAVVNGQPITDQAFVERLKSQFGYLTLEQMIEDAAIQQAAAKAGVKVTDEEIMARVRSIQQAVDSRSSATGLNFPMWLAGQNLTIGAFKSQIRLEMLVEAMVKDKVKITQAQVSDAYEKSRDQFRQPERVKASHICVKTKAEAEKIRADILAGKKTFADAARESSIDPYSKNQGGELGYVTAGEDPLQKTAFALQKDGDLSPVIQTKMGFHIIKRDGRESERVVPFEEVEAQLRAMLERQETQKLTGQKRDEIMKAAQIDRKVKLDPGMPTPADLGVATPPGQPEH